MWEFPGFILVSTIRQMYLKERMKNRLHRMWSTSYQRTVDLYIKKISPFGAFGNYLIWGLVLGLGFFFIFAKLAGELLENELKVFDQIVINATNSISSPVTDYIMKGITMLGSPATMIFLAQLVLFYLFKIKKHIWDSTIVIIAWLGSWAMNELLK